jgi:glutaminase
MEENKQPLSLEQAGNLLKAKDKTMSADIKKDVAKAQITHTPKPDRIKYLMYTIGLLTDVSPEVEHAFYKMTKFISASMTRKEIAALLQKILRARVMGASPQRIAYALKEPVERIKLLEQLGQIAVCEMIERMKLAGVPILNGLN